MTDFDDYQTQSRSASPPWLSKVLGLAWSLVLGTMKQALLEAGKEAAIVSFPSYAPPDALPHIAAQRDVPFGFPEDFTAQRDRLRQSWRVHARGGAHAGIILALQQIGYPNVVIQDHGTISQIPEWHFRVELNRPFPFDDQHLADTVWDSGVGAWDDGGVWASAMPEGHLALIRALIAKFKSSESRCLTIRVNYDPFNALDRVELDP